MKPRLSSPSTPLLNLVITSLVLFSGTAGAAIRSKKAAAPVANEVYAATDSNESQAGFAMPVEAPVAAPVATAPVKTTTIAKAKAPALVQAPAAPVAKSSPISYDPVPASQADAILQRIKIVENLVRKYGRAYDYRAHTLKELQLIQSTLEGTAAPAPRAVVAPVAVAAPAPVAPAPVAAPASQSDTISTGQAAVIENAEDTNLRTLPAPAEFVPNNDGQEN